MIPHASCYEKCNLSTWNWVCEVVLYNTSYISVHFNLLSTQATSFSTLCHSLACVGTLHYCTYSYSVVTCVLQAHSTHSYRHSTRPCGMHARQTAGLVQFHRAPSHSWSPSQSERVCTCILILTHTEMRYLDKETLLCMWWAYLNSSPLTSRATDCFALALTIFS